MQLKKSFAYLACLGMVVSMGTSAFADAINARVKSFDPVAHTITVTERQQDFVFNTTDATKFLNGEGSALEAVPTAEQLKAGTRLSITYDKIEDKLVASQVKLRDLKK